MSEMVVVEDVDLLAATPTAVLARDTRALGQHIEGLWQANQRKRSFGRHAIAQTTREYGGARLSMANRSGHGYNVVDWWIGNLLTTAVVDVEGSSNYSWMASGMLSAGPKNERNFGVSLKQILTTESIDDPEGPQAEILKRIRISPQEYKGVTCAMLYHPQRSGAFPAESFRFFPDDEYYEPLFVVNSAREALGDKTN